jgi:hypothetical protein
MREALRAWVRRRGWDDVLEAADGGHGTTPPQQSQQEQQQPQQVVPRDSTNYSCTGSTSVRLADPDVYSFQATEACMSMSST